jgi:hypothetical protein
VLVDDEWHAVHKLLSSGYWSIATDLGDNDNCIPLTLFYKLLADTIGLSELAMRLPSLLSGISVLVIGPVLSVPFVGKRGARVFAWLLAISPLHIFFSRLARPYAIVAFASAIALPSYFEWYRSGNKHAYRRFVLLASIGSYSHLSALPALVAPWGYAALHRMLRWEPRSRVNIRQIGVSASVLTLVLAILVGPAIVHSSKALTGKLTVGVVTFDAAYGAVTLLVGTANRAVLAVVALVLVCAWRHAVWRHEYARFLFVVIVCHVASLAVLRPAMISVPVVLARYSAVVLPGMLTLLAIVIARVSERVDERWRPMASAVVLGSILGILVYSGPLRNIYAWPNNFTNHASFQASYDGEMYFNRFKPVATPAFYYELATHTPGSILIVEAPWYYYWHSYAAYQRLHRQRVAIGFTNRSNAPPVRLGEVPVNSNLVFRNAIHLIDRAALVRLGVDYVLLHKNVAYEANLPFSDVPLDMTEWITEFEILYGSPYYEDPFVAVFDVRRPLVPMCYGQ